MTLSFGKTSFWIFPSSLVLQVSVTSKSPSELLEPNYKVGSQRRKPTHGQRRGNDTRLGLTFQKQDASHSSGKPSRESESSDDDQSMESDQPGPKKSLGPSDADEEISPPQNAVRTRVKLPEQTASLAKSCMGGTFKIWSDRD
ncbi:unnamed protein product [Caenorhabditis auriculariae]|uniref:Uncharacterized protein n=1 Tax=Caenorhabditis auriculariae TaxID=2777116 RepID=A0A8S1GS33_9PELO|nr:unnamed protein product [Caenorhabditis auriculariae]